MSEIEKNCFGFNKLHPRFLGIVMPFILSCIMSAVVSLVSILKHVGFVDGLWSLWLGAWLSSWVVAFPTVLIMLPFARRLAFMFVRKPSL
ncbi:MAG: DUF2798 domain-containing protein [Neisseriaceae bacterium]|nr:DUF2798 domain-containing protein [Neisseriaceae bacterium]MBP6861306.1 DUF2798 domain-containing protein [Neisseriaceae bacterium]